MALGFEDRLVKNLEDFKTLSGYVFDEEVSFDEFHEKLQERVESCTRIIDENRAIMEKEFKPLLQDLGSLPKPAADSLFELQAKLYSFSNPLDMGFSLEILEILTRWAKKHQETDMLIKCLYHSGFIYQQINDKLKRFGVEIFREKCAQVFSEAASYNKDYFDIKSKETRSYINRCLGNLYVISHRLDFADEAELMKWMGDFFDKVDAAFDFWNNGVVREFDPDLPWERYIINAHQNTANWVWILSREKYWLEDMYLHRRVSNSCTFLLQLEDSAVLGDYWSPHRSEYMEYASEYCLGNISYQEMVDNVRAMYLSADDFDYTLSGMYANLSTPISLIMLIKPELKQGVSFQTEVKLIIERMHDYCKNFPPDGNKNMFMSYVASASKSMVEVLDFDDAIELILGLTINTHLPTYVHSVMVQELTSIIADYVLSSKPEYFIGIAQTSSTFDVTLNKNEVREITGLAALCHDVGKILYLDRVAIFSRKLYDFEFDIIKKHTNADGLIKAGNEKMQLVQAVISGHHMWYNNERGYGSINDKYRAVINIVSVADSIDAATDGVGRFYSKAISLEGVIREIHEQAGSRYCPVIADSLRDGALVEKIREAITKGRKKAYYEAYLHMRGDRQ